MIMIYFVDPFIVYLVVESKKKDRECVRARVCVWSKAEYTVDEGSNMAANSYLVEATFPKSTLCEVWE